MVEKLNVQGARLQRRISERMAQVQAPMIPVVGEWIAQNPGTISLGQGIVGFSPPEEVAAAVTQAVHQDPRIARYGLVRGLDEWLTQIEAKVATENGITMGSERTAIGTAGSNMGFLNAVLAIGDVGDEIIVLSPFYFNHQMAIEIAGCRVVVVETDENFQPVLERIEAALTPRTRAVVTISPNNPTGAVYSRESLVAVNELCRQRGIYHISDEAYEYFVYGDESHFSPASLPNSSAHTISLFSLSKAYGMAGWRTGYMIVPSALVTAIKKIQDTNLICPPLICQLAATAAMKSGAEWCRPRIEPLGSVRQLVLKRLDELGDLCEVPRPDGAFYVLIRLRTSRPDLELVESLIRGYGVAVMPGSTFGVQEGCLLRIAYGSLDERTVDDGMERLVTGLRHLINK